MIVPFDRLDALQRDAASVGDAEHSLSGPMFSVPPVFSTVIEPKPVALEPRRSGAGCLKTPTASRRRHNCQAHKEIGTGLIAGSGM